MNHSRRHVLGGAVALPALVAAASVRASTAQTPFAAALAASQLAERRLNALPPGTSLAAYEREEAAFLAASRRADCATPGDWSEFVQLFEHMVDHGESRLTDDNEDRLLAHARRLTREGR